VALLRLGVGDRLQSMSVYGMTAEARKAGYQLLVSIEETWANDGDKGFRRTVDDLVGRRVDGLIIRRGVPLETPTRRYLASLGLPVLYASWAPPNGAHQVRFDGHSAMSQALEHLKALGHRRLAHFPSPGAMDFPGHRILPLKRLCAQLGLSLDVVTPDKRFTTSDPMESWTYDGVRRYLARTEIGASRATAMILPGMDGPYAAMIALQEAGLSTPGEMSLLALQDSPMFTLSNPKITAVACDWEAYGRELFSTLLKMIENPDISPFRKLLPAQLHVRDSTGPVLEQTLDRSDLSGPSEASAEVNSFT
jgi:DNA-binding LacI/PurR family transcriptional regulator